MRFRLRISLVFLLLSALPLALLAIYSFTRSSAALRRAVEAEAELMAGELENRLGVAALELNQKVRELARLPTHYWLRTPNGEGTESNEQRRIVAGLAEALPFIEEFKFVPAAPPGEASGVQARWLWKSGEVPAPPSEPDVADALKAAEASVVASVAGLPASMPKAERERVAAELARVREEIRATLAERQAIAARKAVPTPGRPAEEVRNDRLETPKAAGKKTAIDDISCPVQDNGEVVGELQGKLKAREILKTVLAKTRRDQGEIPFAIDSANQLLVADDADGAALEKLPGIAALRGKPAAAGGESERQWIIVSRKDDASGFRLGIARPISRAMKELKSETALNFLAAFFLIGLTTVGMIPLTSGLVRKVHALEEGAARIAGGDLTTRVPVTSRDEFGRLAASFNHMASELAANQAKLLEQERIQKEREIERRLLAAENDRKSHELEEARRFQLSLLPRELPERPGLEIAVAMSTATEVGGDYYDVREVDGAGSDLAFAIGDATGHGAAAGTMVTVVKSLFMAAPATEAPAAFLRRATGLVHAMGLSRMAMALTVARLSGSRLRLSSAGMPPALHFRAGRGEIEEVVLAGMPLGARAEFAYQEREVDLLPGDTLLLMSDGFPELTNAAGEVMGYERARSIFAAIAERPAAEIVATLERAVADWSGDGSPSDDVTFLALRQR